MKIAILGGGLTGLTASFYLSKKSHQTIIFEKEAILGGMASGFKGQDWSWYLEKTIHHIFSNDNDILNFAKEVGFNQIFFKSPETASLYKIGEDNYRIFPVDTPQDFLKFPLFSFPQKIRVGLVLAFIKLTPFLSFYEKQTAAEFLKKTMGEQGWKVLWESLFRKKFGKYAENILASFIWARIKKRTKKLGYIKGGFQTFINFLEEKSKANGVIIKKGKTIDKIIQLPNNQFLIDNKKFDVVVSTLPTPILITLTGSIFPDNYLQRLRRINYLHAVSLVLETEKPIIKKTYWLNIVDFTIPIMGIFQQTNFIDKKYYQGNEIVYLGWYVDKNDKIWQMNKKNLVNFVLPYLKKISPSPVNIKNSYLFKALYAQPIFDKEFLKNKPDFVSPIKNFYIANLDMTYPYDRGTNYAVKLGRQVAAMI